MLANFFFNELVSFSFLTTFLPPVFIMIGIIGVDFFIRYCAPSNIDKLYRYGLLLEIKLGEIMKFGKKAYVIILIVSCFFLSCCKNKDNSINNLITEEWELFIYSQLAWNWTIWNWNSENLEGLKIQDYSDNLENMILEIVKKRYPSLEIQNIDDLLSFTLLSPKQDSYIFMKQVENLDLRIKQAIASYAHVQSLLFKGHEDRRNIPPRYSRRSAQSTAFFLTNDEVRSFLGYLELDKRWELFIFAQQAWDYTINSHDIINYSSNLEKKIIDTINTFYPNIYCQTMDIFLEAFTELNELFDANNQRLLHLMVEEISNIDFRIKYAIFAYGYINYLLDNHLITSRALAFELNYDDTKKILGRAYPYFNY